MLKRSAVSLLLLSLLAALASAQVYSTIRGTVVDPSGAAHPNVAITVTNVENGAQERVNSNELGDYVLPTLMAGKYVIAAEQAGFKSFKTGTVELLPGKDVRVDIKMELGTQAEVVTVSGEQGLIETERATLTDSKTVEVFTAVPVNTGFRSIWRMLDLSPGVNSSGTYIAGSNKYQDSTFSIDGIPMAGGWGPVGPGFSYTDSYREFHVDYSGNNASTGTAAAVSMISESGTNEFHGEGWMHYNAPSFIARSFFSNSTTGNHGPPTIRPNVRIGGPVRLPFYNGTNRTFFHFTYQGLRGGASPETNQFVVPAAAYRVGDFSSLSGITVKDPVTGNPFPGNQIPSQRISSVSQGFQKYYSPVNSGADSFVNTIVVPNPDNFYAARLDHQIGSRNTIFGRYTFHRETVDHTDNNGEPLIGVASQFRQQTVVTISDTHTFSPHLFNEFRFGYSSDHSINHGSLKASDVMTATGLQVPTVGSALDTYGMPVINIDGFNSISETNYNAWTWGNYYVTQDLRYVLGRHNFVFGGQFSQNNGILYPTSPADTLGQYTFDGSLSGYSYADFLLGMPSHIQTTTSVSPVNTHRNSWAAYVTDSWKVTPRLTLELGLRWDYLDPGYVENGVFSSFVPARNALVVPTQAALKLVNPAFPTNIPILTAEQAGISSKLQNGNYKNFAPRFGFAWRPTRRDDLVLRGGAGLYYALLQPHPTDGGGAPFEFPQSYQQRLDANGVLASPFMFPSPFPSVVGEGGGTDIGGMDPNLKTPRNMQYNFSVQKQVKDIALTLGYMATLARQGVYTMDLNQPHADLTPFDTKMESRPYPYFWGANYQVNGSNHNYHAMFLSGERRLRGGFFLSSNFTWAKDMGTDWTGPEDTWNLARDKTQGGSIPHRRFVTAFMYELPLGKGRLLLNHLPRAADSILGGWQLSGTFVAQSGLFFTPSYSGVDASNTGVTGGRPDRIADGNLPNGQRTLDRWFDPSAFVKPAAGIGRFGNSGAYILEGPGLNVWHADLQKSFTLYERLRLRLQATATDVFNHPNFRNPNATVGSSSMGRITSVISTDGGRNLQLTARLIF